MKTAPRSYGRGLQTDVQRAVYLNVNAELAFRRAIDLLSPAPPPGMPPVEDGNDGNDGKQGSNGTPAAEDDLPNSQLSTLNSQPS